jgi:hypothetical protein
MLYFLPDTAFISVASAAGFIGGISTSTFLMFVRTQLMTIVPLSERPLFAVASESYVSLRLLGLYSVEPILKFPLPDSAM